MPKTQVTGMTERRDNNGKLLEVSVELEQDPPPADHIKRAYIISGTYTCDKGQVIPSKDLTGAVVSFLDTCDVDPEMIMAYTQAYFVRPEKIALKDVWLDMDDNGRNTLVRLFPQLAAAIQILVGGEEG